VKRGRRRVEEERRKKKEKRRSEADKKEGVFVAAQSGRCRQNSKSLGRQR
jgi:hypothetical protein